SEQGNGERRRVRQRLLRAEERTCRRQPERRADLGRLVLLPEWPAAGARRGLLHQRRPHRHHQRREHFGSECFEDVLRGLVPEAGALRSGVAAALTCAGAICPGARAPTTTGSFGEAVLGRGPSVCATTTSG